MTIRAARPADYPTVGRLLLQIAQLHHELRPDIFRPASRKYNLKQYKALLRKKKSPILVAENPRGEVLGYAMCKIHTWRNPVMVKRTGLWVDDLCVDESARGQGIGEALMEAVYDLAREKGIARIELNVWECNEGARRFYERLGFTAQRRGMELNIK